MSMDVVKFDYGTSRDFEFASDPFFYTTPENAFERGIFVQVPMVAGFNSEDGIVKAAKFISNRTLLDNLNSNWDLYGTSEIFDKCCDFTQAELFMSQSIR